jgi:hypothetical protein
MLDELERKLTTVVADALASRAGVAVVEGVGELPAPSAGGGAVAVALTAVEPEPIFARESVELTNGAGPPRSRRVLPLGFTATVTFARRATAEDASSLGQAKRALLRDASLVAHAFGTLDAASGDAFEVPGDPGFDVRAFGLVSGALDAPREGPVLRTSFSYGGLVVVWPPDATGPEGTIDAVGTLVEALPITIAPDDPVVSIGGSTTVRVRSVTGRRIAAAGSPTPPRLALLVVSDLPPAERGAIASGAPGGEAGVRLVDAAGTEVVVAYQAPTADPGATRSERVAVHLARPDGSRGLFLGSAAIVLSNGGP